MNIERTMIFAGKVKPCALVTMSKLWAIDLGECILKFFMLRTGH